MKAKLYILLFISIPILSIGQISNQHWIAGGSDNMHHNSNVDRAIKGIYGKAISEKTFVSIPDFISSWDFDIFSLEKDKGNYLFHKKISKSGEKPLKFVVYSKKDSEYEYVTVSDSYMIIYQYINQMMVIYKIR